MNRLFTCRAPDRTSEFLLRSDHRVVTTHRWKGQPLTIELVCLDLAGTTVGDDDTVIRSFAAALTDVGLLPETPPYETAMDYARRTMGHSKIEVFQAIFNGDDTQASEANSAFDRAYNTEIEAGIEPIEGAEEAIRMLRDDGVKVALTTGFSVATRQALLDSLEWSDLCDLALSPADAGRGRPAPDMLLTALIRLAVDDVRALAAAGDATADLMAGTRAGASVVAGVLTGAHTAEQLAEAPHTHILKSVVDLPDVIFDYNRKDPA